MSGKNKAKKAQLTLFVIVGISLFAIIAIIYTLMGSKISEISVPDSGNGLAAPVSNYVEQCIRQTSAEGVNYISLRGGFYKPRKPYIKLGGIKIAYYYYISDDNTANLLAPSKHTLESELAGYIKDNIGYCLGNFTAFADQGLIIDPGSPQSVSVALTENSANIMVILPVSITADGKKLDISRFNARVSTKLLYAFNTAKKYADYQSRYPDYVVLSELIRLSRQHGLHYRLFYLNDSVVFAFDFNHTNFNSFVFANKYNWSSEENHETNAKPVIGNIGEKTAYVSDRYFVYKVNAVDPDNDNMFFLADSDFDININPLSGVINISLSKQLVGEHKINVSVIDARGKISNSNFMLVIKNG